MKAIINEKLYDTTTASVVFSDGTTALFKTKNDAYFRTSSEGIEPLTDDEAKAFLGVADADAYIKEFGSVESA